MFTILQLARLLEFTLSTAAYADDTQAQNEIDRKRLVAEADQIERLITAAISQHLSAKKKARDRHDKKHAGQKQTVPVTTKST